MSFSTRSSCERNGSLHSTVRWAWSLSLRCTQSTVKSRRFSWARRMNSPRSRALVVCGGAFLPSKIATSEATRSTEPFRSQQVVEPAAAVDVVVGEVELGDPRRGQGQAVPGPVALDQLVLGGPVDLPVDQRQVAGGDRVQRAPPQLDHPLGHRVAAAPVDEVRGLLVVLALDVQRGRLPAVGQLDPAPGR